MPEEIPAELHFNVNASRKMTIESISLRPSDQIRLLYFDNFPADSKIG